MLLTLCHTLNNGIPRGGTASGVATVFTRMTLGVGR